MEAEPRIVLCMLAGDDERTIERSLDAALPLVDAWVVCTHGTDRSHELVEQRGAEKPGLLLRHEWRDFGHQRSLALKAATAWLAERSLGDAERSWPIQETYLLLVDADLVLQVDPAFSRAELAAPHYEVELLKGGVRSFHSILLRLSHAWRCVGVASEYWRASGAPPAERLATLRVESIEDPASWPARLARRIALLERGLEDEPGNVRYLLELGNAHFEAGHYEQAEYWYDRRVEAAGDEEACWYAAYRLGLARLYQGQGELGAGQVLAAYQRRPSRAEPLCALSKHYRERGKNQLAHLLARQARELTLPRNDRVGVEPEAYRSRALEEIAITAYYVGKLDEGLEACEQLLAQRGHPASIYEYVARNELFYLPPDAAPVRRGTCEAPEPEVEPILHFRVDGELYLIVSHDPLVVHAVDEALGISTEVSRWAPPWHCSRWRSSTAPVRFDGDRWLMLVHEIVESPSGAVHVQRWVELRVGSPPGEGARLDVSVTRYGRPFTFEQQGVEVALKLAFQRDTFIVTYRSVTGEARFMEFERSRVEARLGA